MDDNFVESGGGHQPKAGWERWQVYALQKLAGDDAASYKSVKKALYNAAIHFSFIFVAAVGCALYFVFSAFSRPLLWALMCGSFLFPLKSAAASTVIRWLASLETTGRPLLVGVLLLPFQLLKNCADLVEQILYSKWQSLTSLCAVISLSMCMEHLPVWDAVDHGVCAVSWLATHTLEFTERHQMEALSILAAHLVCVLLWWDVPWCQTFLRVSSPFVWIILLFFLASYVPSYRLAMFLVVTALCAIGFIAGMPRQGTSLQHSAKPESAASTGDEGCSSVAHSTSKKIRVRKRRYYRHIPFSPASPSPRVDSYSTHAVREMILSTLQSRAHFRALLWGCLALAVYRNRHFLLQLMNLQHTGAGKRWMQSLQRRSDALVPAPLRGTVRCILVGDRKAASWLKEFVDPCVTIFLMAALVVCVLIVAFVLAVQVRHESMHVVTAAGSVWDDVLDSYPDLKRWRGGDFPKKLLDFGDVLRQQAIQHGRSWLTSWLQHAAPNNETALQIEAELWAVFDSAYTSWGNQSQHFRTGVSSNARNFSLDGAFVWLSAEKLSGVFAVVKENIGTLQATLESVMLVVRGNMNMLLTFLTVILSILVGSGSAVLNFFLSGVIFSTSLFYLLSLSKNSYAPGEWLMFIFPHSDAGQKQDTSEVISASVQGVFGATLQMITFYGVFTYFTHNLFSFQIVVIPAIAAAVFAAVPFVGTYWVAVPAALYLWLVEESILHSLVLISMHIVAFYYVDMAIYSEIKGGGHPYLTGLAVAGGVYIFGLDGAVIGPILLCCGLVGWRIIRNVFNDDMPMQYGRYCSESG